MREFAVSHFGTGLGDGSGAVGVRTVNVRGLRGGHVFEAADYVAEEMPVALEYNGIAHAVMLATPLYLEDFALGFSLTEGILDSPSQLYAVDEEVSAQGVTLRLSVASSAFARLKERRRTLAGRTGCGLCGTENLSEVSRPLPDLSSAGLAVLPEAISRAMAQFSTLQTLNKSTGSVHAAAWCSVDGDVKYLREDIGRHNALDKLVGALARADFDAAGGFIAVTSRASFEMVQKTAMAKVPLLAAVSAPTSLAVATAESAGMTLIGFARGRDMTIYSRAERLRLHDAEHFDPLRLHLQDPEAFDEY